MVSAIVLTNLLLVFPALAAPVLDTKAPVQRFQYMGFNENMAGAAYTGFIPGTFTAVSAILTIPVISVPQVYAYLPDGGTVVARVGIDGYSCGPNTFQTGISFAIIYGEVTYSTWYQFSDHIINFVDDMDIQVGDDIRLSVTTTSTSTGIAKIENLTNPQNISQAIQSPFTLCRRDAMWMVDVPGILPSFDMVFSEAVATTPDVTIGPNDDSIQIMSFRHAYGYGQAFVLKASVDSSHVNFTG